MGDRSADYDNGYFPHGNSMLRRVQAERVVGLLFGQRALCIGALAPLNYVGTSEHTHVRTMPFKRLVPTGKAFETVFFAACSVADQVLRRTRQKHERVNGTLPEDAGPFPKGTRYSALHDQEMLWTIAVMMDSAQFFYELLVCPLTDTELEELWQDYLRFGELWGMSRSCAPQTYRAFRKWFEQELTSDRMYLTDEARQVGYQSAFEIPMPRRYKVAKWIHDLLLLGSLPPRVRELYNLRFPLSKRVAFKLTVRLLCLARRISPRRLTRGPNTSFFDRIEQTERWRIAKGKPTPQLWPRPHRHSPIADRVADSRPSEAPGG
jgi:uncharacterized protein (DUF2236 family)